MCAGCGTPLHEECFAEHGRCVVLGCDAKGAAKPTIRLELPRSGWRGSVVGAVVLGLLTAMLAAPAFVGVLWAMNDGCRAARSMKVYADCHTLKKAASMFKLNHGRYPQSIEELWELPGSVKHWDGPYIDPCPRDPWGRRYKLAFEGGLPIVCVEAQDENGGNVDFPTGG